jgi:acyl dehydratase
MSGLISEEARAWIGRDYGSVTIAVGRNDIVRFALATGEEDPVHLDTEAARRSGWRDVVASPGFLSVLAAYSQLLVPRSRLRHDGLVHEQYPPLPVNRVVIGEVDQQFHRAIVAGDEITVSKRLVGMTEREGRQGAMVVIDFERRYIDQEDMLVAEERYSVVVR